LGFLQNHFGKGKNYNEYYSTSLFLHKIDDITLK
jgi:hypothetical protein